MLVFQGDTRVADIFLTEFMRLFNQCTNRGRFVPRATDENVNRVRGGGLSRPRQKVM
ncbi:MAG: hypothetical protein ACLQU5_13720 [Isosphaeraceae bacterium]|jgi:hypothetical protein